VAGRSQANELGILDFASPATAATAPLGMTKPLEVFAGILRYDQDDSGEGQWSET